MIVSGSVITLPQENLDTDQMYPGKYLSLITRKGLGRLLFEAFPTGRELLEKNPGASILVAGENIGCGSSREHAVWALADWGIKAIIAPSFARIFHENCYSNGVVPVVLTDKAALDACFSAKTLDVDVDNETVSKDGREIARFELDPLRKDFILHGGFLEFMATKVDQVRAWRTRSIAASR
jgi:3-isopropylmalate/(R)-2-methylmalate dehydratase small subunit